MIPYELYRELWEKTESGTEEDCKADYKRYLEIHARCNNK